EARDPARVGCALASFILRRLHKGISRKVDGFNDLLICWRLALAGRIEKRCQGFGKRRDDRELFVLIVRHEALDAYDARDLWQFFKTRGKRRDGSEIGRK